MTSYNTMLAGLQDLVDNPTPRVPVILCLDVSGSMSGAPIRELNTGANQFLREMEEDELTRYSAEIAVVTFADRAQCVTDFDTADRLDQVSMTADGCTDLGGGLTMALDLLERRKNQYKATGVEYYQPILVVMSDGAPNGDRRVQDAAVRRLRELAEARKLTVIPVGIGPQADLDMLACLAPKGAPLRMDGLRFREFFAWLSQSVAGVSASAPGCEPELDLDALRELESEPWPEESL